MPGVIAGGTVTDVLVQYLCLLSERKRQIAEIKFPSFVILLNLLAFHT